MEGTNITLYRNDIIQSAPAYKGSMKLLPLGKRTRQKVVLGDTDGVIQVFSVKKKETVGVFKSLPLHRAITRVELGKGSGQQDKIFYCYDQTVVGVNKKGKQFFQYSSNLTEEIKALTVNGLTFFTAGDYVCNKIENSNDVQQYVSRDRINEMITARISFSGMAEVCPVLVCQDRSLKVLKDGEVYYEASLDTIPTTIAEVESVISGGAGYSTLELCIGRREIIYGTERGGLGQLFLDSDAIRRGWNMPVENSVGGVNCVCAKYDFTGDGIPDIIVGKDDGTVEIFSTGDAVAQPEKIYSGNVADSVSSIHMGYVTNEESQDVAIHTFSGNFLCLSQKPSKAKGRAQGGVDEEILNIEEDAMRAERTRKEIEQLRSKLENLKEKVHRNQTSAVQSSNAIKMNVRHILNHHDEVSHVVRVEIAIPVMKIALKSDLPLEFIHDNDSDVQRRISNTKSPSERYSTLAVHILDRPSKRADFRFKASEGKSGQVQLFILPEESFHYSQSHTINIKPLCLHQAIGREEAEDYLVRPLNKLSITGHFSMQEMHNWICFCLMDIPTRAPHTRQETLYFVSTFLDTFLLINYQEGEGHFSSDSISTLAIVRDVITQRATLQKQRLNISFHANEDSVPQFCQLIFPRLRGLTSMYQQSSLVDALKEVSAQEGNLDCFTDAQKKMIRSVSENQNERNKGTLESKKKDLDQLVGLVKTFYFDWHKFSGKALKKTYSQDIEALLSRLDTTLDDVILYINN
ncbi:Bardet-Biedl syndrome 7-like protein [Chloropicon primus]|uniref:Bardet-Biedl syndrome 7-like protein n=1 Tax=Chloropicon primus TaxID=1764295 RepID=A0A5B8MLU2_9CHLO|nr:Bardet-Biedl syndrome 7-like protein [Chloropicon primus]UPR00445.1 Bardet-Biedl syndrome 7-like protein [Chloropicon primus]|eukprot:QDZ21231.1 Bardet-Biedl syndrome 7-like protein [Chloropicon primus]